MPGRSELNSFEDLAELLTVRVNSFAGSIRSKSREPRVINYSVWKIQGFIYLFTRYMIGAARYTGIRDSVTRLSLGKLLVNLLQVVKRTDTPVIPS